MVTDDQPLAVDLDWALTIAPSTMTKIGGFAGAQPDETSLVFDDEVPLETMMSGGIVSGSFSFGGGAYTLTSLGEVTDDTAEGLGCFRIRADATTL